MHTKERFFTRRSISSLILFRNVRHGGNDNRQDWIIIVFRFFVDSVASYCLDQNFLWSWTWSPTAEKKWRSVFIKYVNNLLTPILSIKYYVIKKWLLENYFPTSEESWESFVAKYSHWALDTTGRWPGSVLNDVPPSTSQTKSHLHTHLHICLIKTLNLQLELMCFITYRLSD